MRLRGIVHRVRHRHERQALKTQALSPGQRFAVLLHRVENLVAQGLAAPAPPPAPGRKEPFCSELPHAVIQFVDGAQRRPVSVNWRAVGEMKKRLQNRARKRLKHWMKGHRHDRAAGRLVPS
jgi:hypothetical protein